MLEGIHILNKTVITETIIPNENLSKVAAIIFIITFIITLASLSSKSNICGYAAIICIVALITWMIQMAHGEEVPTDRYRYEVTVGPYVRFTDIYEKYDVVERRGEIWVLEDKDE